MRDNDKGKAKRQFTSGTIWKPSTTLETSTFVEEKNDGKPRQFSKEATYQPSTEVNGDGKLLFGRHAYDINQLLGKEEEIDEENIPTLDDIIVNNDIEPD